MQKLNVKQNVIQEFLAITMAFLALGFIPRIYAVVIPIIYMEKLRFMNGRIVVNGIMEMVRESPVIAVIYHEIITEGMHKMNLTIFLLMILLTLSVGCMLRHVDSITQFLITGEVLDKNTNKPIDKVKVVFIDTGFDSVRSKQLIPKKIGESDNDGQITLTFDYWWGVDEGLFKEKAQRTFDIVLSRDRYREERFNFRATDLPSEGKKLKVFLNKVYLKPIDK